MGEVQQQQVLLAKDQGVPSINIPRVKQEGELLVTPGQYRDVDEPVEITFGKDAPNYSVLVSRGVVAGENGTFAIAKQTDPMTLSHTFTVLNPLSADHHDIIPFTKPLRIGRGGDVDVDITLPFDRNHVSRLHTEIENKPDRMTITHRSGLFTTGVARGEKIVIPSNEGSFLSLEQINSLKIPGVSLTDVGNTVIVDTVSGIANLRPGTRQNFNGLTLINTGSGFFVINETGNILSVPQKSNQQSPALQPARVDAEKPVQSTELTQAERLGIVPPGQIEARKFASVLADEIAQNGAYYVHGKIHMSVLPRENSMDQDQARDCGASYKNKSGEFKTKIPAPDGKSPVQRETILNIVKSIAPLPNVYFNQNSGGVKTDTFPLVVTRESLKNATQRQILDFDGPGTQAEEIPSQTEWVVYSLTGLTDSYVIDKRAKQCLFTAVIAVPPRVAAMIDPHLDPSKQEHPYMLYEILKKLPRLQDKIGQNPQTQIALTSGVTNFTQIDLGTNPQREIHVPINNKTVGEEIEFVR